MRWPAPTGPKVDEREPGPADGADLAGRYEDLRAAVCARGTGRAGLGAALLMAKGVGAWMAGWRACTPPAPTRGRPAASAPPAEVVSVLASMALACA